MIKFGTWQTPKKLCFTKKFSVDDTGMVLEEKVEMMAKEESKIWEEMFVATEHIVEKVSKTLVVLTLENGYDDGNELYDEICPTRLNWKTNVFLIHKLGFSISSPWIAYIFYVTLCMPMCLHES